jgi:hypothetical protein
MKASVEDAVLSVCLAAFRLQKSAKPFSLSCFSAAAAAAAAGLCCVQTRLERAGAASFVTLLETLHDASQEQVSSA